MNTIRRFLLDSARYLDLDPAQTLGLLCDMQQRPTCKPEPQRMRLCA